MDCILSGEHAVSIVLLNNNYNICSLVNKDIDYRIKENWKYLKFNSDRYPNFIYFISNVGH